MRIVCNTKIINFYFIISYNDTSIIWINSSQKKKKKRNYENVIVLDTTLMH